MSEQLQFDRQRLELERRRADLDEARFHRDGRMASRYGTVLISGLLSVAALGVSGIQACIATQDRRSEATAANVRWQQEQRAAAAKYVLDHPEILTGSPQDVLLRSQILASAFPRDIVDPILASVKQFAGSDTKRLVATVLDRPVTCEEFQQRLPLGQVVCNSATAPGYYWAVGKKLFPWPAYGYLLHPPPGSTDTPPCGSTEQVGTTAETGRFDPTSRWVGAVARIVPYDHRPDGSTDGSFEFDRGRNPYRSDLWTTTDFANTGIFQVTCQQQDPSGTR